MKNTETVQGDQFPLDLLTQPAAKRKAYFNGYIIKHPKLLKADKALWRAIHTPVSESIIFVIGPAGVGKSTLCRRISERLAAEIDGTGDGEVRAAPLVTKAPPPEGGSFKWENFYKKSLITLEKAYFEKSHSDLSASANPRIAPAIQFSFGFAAGIASLRLINALEYRRPPAFFIDEAQHIGKTATGRKLQDQMDVIKTLASVPQTRLVLIGTYELLNLLNLSGQLSRRGREIHFMRYGTSAEDIKAFKSILLDFQRHLPLMIEPTLIKHWEYFYVHSVGCVGTLKDWLMRALDEALEDDARTITQEIVERNALSAVKCESIAQEAVEGESRLSNQGNAFARLLRLLGFTDSSPEINNSASQDQSSNELKTVPRLPRPVGRRSPRRDPVGRK